jgi:hypothetical protein
MSRVYLAARYGRREEILGRAVELAEDGHTVTSRWLIGVQQWDAATMAAAAAFEERGETPPEAARFAIEDWADLRSSDVVVLFTEPPGSGAGTRGGRHVEFGMAYALGKRCLVVGGRENVFHLLPAVEHHPTWERARRRLRPPVAVVGAASLRRLPDGVRG